MPDRVARIILCAMAPAEYRGLDDSLLSEGERLRASRYRQARDRESYVAAHSLLRRLLQEFHGIPAIAWHFRNNPHGRPEIGAAATAGPLPDFNISHTHDLVACALTMDIHCNGVRLGVDVESCRRSIKSLALAHRYCSPAERDWLQGLPEKDHDQQFLRLWTLKEAVSKALGLGLQMDFRSFTCSVEPLAVILRAEEQRKDWHWYLYNEQLPSGHWLSLAVHHPPNIRIDLIRRDGVDACG